MQHYWKQLLFFISLLSILTTAYADIKEIHYQRYLDRMFALKRTAIPNTIIEKTFNQFIDHNNPQLGTFAQRYYIDESFATAADAPVFLYICGEAECQASRLARKSIRILGEKYHAKLVALEHRYYGKSLPRPTFSTEDLKYLSTDQALKDIANFQTSLIATNKWTGKWITVGGSYAGSLSAYYRLKYPHLVVAALASSAPVMAKENFEEYDAHVTKVVGPKCADNVRAVVREVETVIKNNEQARLLELKKMFGATDITDNTDFLDLFAEITATAVQYGPKDRFCSTLEAEKTLLEGFVKFANYIYTTYQIKAIDLVPEGAMSENPADYGSSGAGMRQWIYQSCTEYGYWQNANSDPAKSTRSAQLNQAYSDHICQRLFGLPLKPNTDHINNDLYLPLLDESVSNIYFPNGSLDPWSTLSLTKENGNDTNSNLEYYLINGASHCNDLREPTPTNSAELTIGRSKFYTLVEKVLQVKQPKSE